MKIIAFKQCYLRQRRNLFTVRVTATYCELAYSSAQ